MEKGNYRHFMEKEIHDQPEGCQRTIAAYVDTLTERTAMPGGVDFAKLRAQAQTAAEQIWDTLADWDPLGRSHEQACPWSYPIAE